MHQQRIDNFFTKKDSSKIRADKLPKWIIREDVHDLGSNYDTDSPNVKTRENSPTNLMSTNFTDIRGLYKNDTATLPFKFYGNSQPISNDTKIYDYSMDNHINNKLLAFVSPAKERMREEKPSSSSRGIKMYKKPGKFKDDPTFFTKWFKKSSENIYSCYDYFSSFQIKNFNAIQLEIIFANGGRLPHIKHMKNMMKGKNVGPFLKKNKLATKISKEYSKGQKLFESFSLEPDKPNSLVLIMDKDVTDICESSKYSLLYINLKSCNLLTSRSFKSIANCRNLQQLSLHRCNIDDISATDIFKSCKNLTKISLCGCDNLTDETLKNVSAFQTKVINLEIASNKSMNLEHLYELRKLPLKKLNLGGNPNLKTDHFLILTQTLPLEELNVQGSESLRDDFLYTLAGSFMMQSIKALNISRNTHFSEEAIWNLVNATMSITDLYYSLPSQRVEEKLKENKKTTFLSQVSND